MRPGPGSAGMPERNSGGGEAAKDLRDLQTAFAAHIRDPDRHEKPAGIEDRRMKIYRELFFSNVSSMLSSIAI